MIVVMAEIVLVSMPLIAAMAALSPNRIIAVPTEHAPTPFLQCPAASCVGMQAF